MGQQSFGEEYLHLYTSILYINHYIIYWQNNSDIRGWTSTYIYFLSNQLSYLFVNCYWPKNELWMWLGLICWMFFSSHTCKHKKKLRFLLVQKHKYEMKWWAACWVFKSDNSWSGFIHTQFSRKTCYWKTIYVFRILDL